MEKLTTLEIGLLISTLIFLFLYIKEKMKPKTEAEILYAKEKDAEEENLRLKEIEDIKKIDTEFKNLTKPVIFNGSDYSEPSYDKYNLTISVTDGSGKSKSFSIFGRIEFLHENAPFFMSIWEMRIKDHEVSPMSVLF